MARTARAEVFSPDEIQIVHVMNRVVRRCFLMGVDDYSGKNYDHRQQWVEDELQRAAGQFGIDLLTFAILSNHFHLVLRSRPDVVALWDDREVARRWLLLCPERKRADGSACQPNQAELNSICLDDAFLAEVRSRLSDISWWMRLVCQRIAQRANAEEEEFGKFWQSRFRAVCLKDELALLACSAYVDLNPIRAAMAETLEASQHTSIQRRLQAFTASLTEAAQADPVGETRRRADAFLAPLEIDQLGDELGARPSCGGTRCSDKGFLSLPPAAYFQLLDWTARQLAAGKSGATPETQPPILERLNIQPAVWLSLVGQFGQLFSLVAGRPQCVDQLRSRRRGQRFNLPQATRQLLEA